MNCNCPLTPITGPTLASTCGGASLMIFMGLLETFLRSQCDLEDPCNRPKPPDRLLSCNGRLWFDCLIGQRIYAARCLTMYSSIKMQHGSVEKMTKDLMLVDPPTTESDSEKRIEEELASEIKELKALKAKAVKIAADKKKKEDAEKIAADKKKKEDAEKKHRKPKTGGGQGNFRGHGSNRDYRNNYRSRGWYQSNKKKKRAGVHQQERNARYYHGQLMKKQKQKNGQSNKQELAEQQPTASKIIHVHGNFIEIHK